MSQMQIKISGLSAFGYHGVFEHEKINGQEFIVDLEINYDASSAISSDNIAEALDYGEITKSVKDIIENTRRDLIEVLANDIADLLIKKDKVIEVSVVLHKPQAPVAVKVSDIAVKITKTK